MPVQKAVQLPIGTLEEIQAQGMDPELVACCHPHVKGSIRGCPQEKFCPFARKALGGFKGKGPRYVGVEVRTSNADGGRRIERIHPCFRYVATLHARALSGMDRKNRGLDHETIRIIGQEGEVIVKQDWKTVAADGGLKSKDFRMKGQDVEVTIPAFPRPGDNPQTTFAQKLDARSKARDLMETEFENMLMEQIAAQRAEARVINSEPVIDDGGAVPVLSGAALDAEPEATVPAAEPVKKKR